MRLFNSTALIAFLGSFALVGLIAWGLFWRVEEVVVAPPQDKPPVVSRTVDLVGRHEGQQRWRLLAEEVEMGSGQQIFDQGAHGYFYGTPSEEDQEDPFFSDQQQMEWEADIARYDAAAELLLLNENVEVRDQDGSRLLTNTLRVTPEEAMDMPEPFTLTGDEMVLSGQEGSFNFQFALMKATSGKLIVLPEASPDLQSGAAQATALVAVAESNPEATIITAQQLTYDRSTQRAVGEGDLVIREEGVEIRAPRGTYDRQLAQSSLEGGVVLQETGQEGGDIVPDFTVAQADAAAEDEEVTIIADQLDYDRNTQIAQGQGNLEIRQGETTLEAPQGSYRRREAQSILNGGVTLREPNRILTAQRLEGNHQDKIFLFEEDVVYRQLAEQEEGATEDGESLTSELRQSETEVRAAKLVYNSPTDTSEFTQNVQFVQKGRQARSETAVITPELVTLTGDVEIQQIDGDWLARRFQDPDAQQDVSRPTLIFADRVEIDQQTSDARFYENVVIVQANRAAEGDKATYYDSSESFELVAVSAPVLLCDRGDVGDVIPDSIEGLPGRDALDVTCRGANRISSDLIELDMANDTFKATGQSMMQFRVSDQEAP
jgi:lipopolysaccharide export system protein LptA